MSARRRIPLSALPVVLACLGCTLSTCEPSAIPDPLSCTNAPAQATIEEVGVATGPGTPIALEDGAPTYTLPAADGTRMVSLRALWRGPDAPACGRVIMRVRDPDDQREIVAREDQLISTPEGPLRASSEVFFDVTDWPDPFQVDVTVFGVTERWVLGLGGWQPPGDGGLDDAGAVDGGEPDASALDAGSPDAGALDGGPADAGPVDAGPVDAGPVDAGAVDAGPVDAGPVDAGPVDAGPVDAGPVDASPTDAG